MILVSELTNAKVDILTGCYTKDTLIPVFLKLSLEYVENKVPFSILFIDMDKFKSLNDKYGHLFGDEALKYFGSSLRLSLSEETVAIRYGGDEFVVVFPGKTSDETHAVAIELEKNVKSRPLLWKCRLFNMSFSAGIASYPNDGKTLEEIIQNADKAMYLSKIRGQGKISQYSKTLQIKLRRLLPAVFIPIFLLVFVCLLSLQRYNKFSLYPLRKIITGKKIKPTPIIVADKIVFKQGGVLEGKIISENEDSVEIILMLKSGEGKLKLNKSEVANIERGAK